MANTLTPSEKAQSVTRTATFEELSSLRADLGAALELIQQIGGEVQLLRRKVAQYMVETEPTPAPADSPTIRQTQIALIRAIKKNPEGKVSEDDIATLRKVLREQHTPRNGEKPRGFALVRERAATYCQKHGCPPNASPDAVHLVHCITWLQALAVVDPGHVLTRYGRLKNYGTLDTEG